jgi:hypothetical protein
LDLAAKNENAFQTAGWFWTKYKSKDLNTVVSENPKTALQEFKEISRTVKGATDDYLTRVKYFRNTIQALDVPNKEQILNEIDILLGTKK